jgi:hypothetical protein
MDTQRREASSFGVIGASPYGGSALSVWKCKPGKLYHIQLKDGTRYVAKHLLCLEFCILFKVEKKPIHIRYSFDYTDKVYHYKTAKERVQEQMEARALRLILFKATVDEHFSWVGNLPGSPGRTSTYDPII